MQDFEGKTAVITGAGSGIGRALAEAAARRGMRLMLSDIEPGPLAETVSLLQAEGAELAQMACDVSDEGQVADLAAQTRATFGAAHLLFNNAGVGGGGNLWELEPAYWRWVLDVNLFGVIHGIHHFTQGMIDQGEGHIINTASIAGLMSAPTTGPYTVSKHAVVAISELLHGELRQANAPVGVSVLCPSFVDTRIYASDRLRPGTPPSSEEQEAVEELAGAFFEKVAIAPQGVAEQVFSAIESNQFYILTHPEGSHAQIESRMRSILDGGVPPASGPGDFPIS